VGGEIDLDLKEENSCLNNQIEEMVWDIRQRFETNITKLR